MKKLGRAVGLAFCSFISLFGWALVASFSPLPIWFAVGLAIVALVFSVTRFALEMMID